jgi:hypothetical protein
MKDGEIDGRINDRSRTKGVPIILSSNRESPRHVIDFKDSVSHEGDIDEWGIIAAA